MVINLIMIIDLVSTVIKVFRKSTKVTTENHHPKNQYQKVDLEAEIEMIIEDQGTMIATPETIAEREETIEEEILDQTEATSTTKETKEMTEEATSQETLMIGTIPEKITTKEGIPEVDTKEETQTLLISSTETIPEIEGQLTVEEVAAEITSHHIR